MDKILIAFPSIVAVALVLQCSPTLGQDHGPVVRADDEHRASIQQHTPQGLRPAIKDKNKACRAPIAVKLAGLFPSE